MGKLTIEKWGARLFCGKVYFRMRTLGPSSQPSKRRTYTKRKVIELHVMRPENAIQFAYKLLILDVRRYE